ncbi:ABC-type transporter, periplasmic subunit family 3 [human gut metagenome]|jgi:polar amino acid transport system substrate-binding protein/glutamine transport system substrate-binding protein|uniref:ABC-type transporter, periplasmic subunit family 3 n=1 Tax=human gut metagenome TaxID=408170 RepID=W1Y3J5_9ZZZZ
MKNSLLKKLLAISTTAMMFFAVGCGTSSSTSATPSKDTGSSSTESSSGNTGSIEGSLKDVTIKIGTSGLFGPFSYYDSDGKTLIGYDLDLINELQKILGFKIDGDSVKAMDYSALTTSVAEGKLDVAAAALCATDERKQVMNFSDIYCDSGLSVMINKDSSTGITGVESLKGKTIAVEKGTASHAYAQKNLPDSKIEVHDTITTAYESLEQGKVDAVIQDGPGCTFYIKTTSGTKLEVVGNEFNQGQTPYAIAFNKNFKYLDQFNSALKQLKDNGTLDKLYDKWCK